MADQDASHPWLGKLHRPSAADFVPPPEPRWWLKKLLPEGSVAIVGALAKAGKSLLVTEMARAITTGTSLFGRTDIGAVRAACVLYLDAELGAWTFHQRWKQYDPERAADQNLVVAHRDLGVNFADPGSCAALQKLVRAVGANVLIVDPINCFTSGSIIDPDAVNQLVNAIREVLLFNADLGTAAVLIGHFNKPTRPSAGYTYDPLDPYNLAGGSWFNKADTMVLLARHDGYTFKRDELGRQYFQDTVSVTLRGGEPVDNFELRFAPAAAPPVFPVPPEPPPLPKVFKVL